MSFRQEGQVEICTDPLRLSEEQDQRQHSGQAE